MINKEVIAKKYANAFFNLYFKNVNENIILNIKEASLYLEKNPNIILFFSLPNLSLSDKNEISNLLISKLKLPNEFIRLINLLIKQNRMFLFNEILKYICNIYKEQNNIVLFEVFSAYPLLDFEKSIISKFLENKLNKKIVLEFKVKDDLIAGIQIKSDNFLWEYSVQKQLHNLKQLILM